MRILFGSWPAYGHLLPMLALIRAAESAGHEVIVTSGSDLEPVVTGLGLTGHRSGVSLAESYARLPRRQVINDLAPADQAAFAAKHLFGAGAVDRARDLLDFVRQWEPDLVVHDVLELGSATAAAMAGVPHVTHGYGPVVPGSASFAAVIGRTIAAAGLADPIIDVLSSPYLEICPPSLVGLEPNPWARVLRMQPSAGEPGGGLPAGFDRLPHDQTVYLTLGTIMNQAPDVFAAAIAGCARLPVNVIVTTGPGFDAGALGALPANVLAVDFLPQADVLPHSSAVVSHAGAGTMLGALCHGLPQLCLPQGTDQPFNTSALLPTGAGLAIEPADITADRVAAALTRLLGEASFGRAARALQTEIGLLPTPTEVLPELLAAT